MRLRPLFMLVVWMVLATLVLCVLAAIPASAQSATSEPQQQEGRNLSLSASDVPVTLSASVSIYFREAAIYVASLSEPITLAVLGSFFLFAFVLRKLKRQDRRPAEAEERPAVPSAQNPAFSRG